MTYSLKPPTSEFHEGDEVVLTTGAYQGTPGIFVELRHDPNWADIKEWNGRVRSHPVEWLKRASSPLLRQPGRV